MSDTFDNMYGSDEDIETTASSNHVPVVSLQSRGAIREIEVDGSKISVVDASVVMRLENTVRNLQSIITRLENDMRNINTRISNNERRIHNMHTELDNKVGYE